MIGDGLVVKQYQWIAAAQVLDAIRERLAADGPVAVTVAGESGAGKSEIAYCLTKLLGHEGLLSVVLSQDDYFRLPPKSNNTRRLEDISWVGPKEVQLGLLDDHLDYLKHKRNRPLTKPLVFFHENRIVSETIPAANYDVIIAEGTYTTLLRNADVRVFIDRDYHDTKEHRLERGRDADVEFVEEVLEIEHGIISQHKELADVVIKAPEELVDAPTDFVVPARAGERTNPG